MDNAYTEHNMKAVVLALFLMIALIPAAGVAGQNDIHDSSSELHGGRQGVPAATPAPGTPVRIRFAAGTIAATRTGHLAPLASDLFVLAAQRGQALEAFVESPGALACTVPGAGRLGSSCREPSRWPPGASSCRPEEITSSPSTRPAALTDYKLTVIIDTPGAAGATRVRFVVGQYIRHRERADHRGGTGSLRAARSGRSDVDGERHRPRASLLRSRRRWRGGHTFQRWPRRLAARIAGDAGLYDRAVSPDAAATYTLTISASPLRPTPTPQPSRVQFQPGATSAAVSGELAPGRTRTYVLAPAWARSCRSPCGRMLEPRS